MAQELLQPKATVKQSLPNQKPCGAERAKRKLMMSPATLELPTQSLKPLIALGPFRGYAARVLRNCGCALSYPKLAAKAHHGGNR